MKTSKFHQLCDVYGKAQEDFANYKSDCHFLAVALVKELKGYYEVPESQFSLYNVDANNEFHLVPPELIHALNLRADSYWQFGIGLTVCRTPETLPVELVLIHLMVRKNSENKFFVKSAIDETEFEVDKKDKKTFIPFFDFLFDSITKSYSEQIQTFTGEKTERKLGYRNYEK